MTWGGFMEAAATGVMWTAFACFFVVAMRNIVALCQLLIAAWVLLTRVQRLTLDLAVPGNGKLLINIG